MQQNYPITIRRIIRQKNYNWNYEIVKPHSIPVFVNEQEIVWQDGIKAIRRGRFYVLNGKIDLGLWHKHGKKYRDTRSFDSFLRGCNGNPLFVVDKQTFSRLEQELEEHQTDTEERRGFEAFLKIVGSGRLFKFPIFY